MKKSVDFFSELDVFGHRSHPLNCEKIPLPSIGYYFSGGLPMLETPEIDRVPEEPFSVVDRGSYLLVEFCGAFSIEASKQCVDRMVTACQQHRQHNVLLDCRRITGPMPVFDRFQVAEYGASQGRQVMRVALVRPAGISPTDTLVEDVAVNRGMDLKIFSEFEAAEHWLGQQPARPVA
jgi:hypothetical protein